MNIKWARAQHFLQEGQDGPVSLTWLPRRFRVSWPFRSKETQYRFSRWRPSWISNQKDFGYFFLSTSHLHISNEVNWPFCSEEKVQNRFSTWLPRRISQSISESCLDFKITRVDCILIEYIPQKVAYLMHWQMDRLTGVFAGCTCNLA